MSGLQTLITALAGDRSLDEPARLRQRIEALDRLEAYLLDGQGTPSEAIGAGLYDRARAIYARLETINHELYQAIRRDIQRGVGPHRLLQWAPGSGRNGRAAGRVNGEGYDYLDVLVSGVLQFEEPDAEVGELAPEMVSYHPTPARHIFDLIGRIELTERDVLVDLGSGMGHVPLLVSICTGACSIGIEREEAYVHCAWRSARALNLTNVTFIQQDARETDFSRGTVFYLYTPFIGTILRAVLDSLQREATSREIRICTYGKCTSTVAEERWLEAVGVPRTDRVALFRCRT